MKNISKWHVNGKQCFLSGSFFISHWMSAQKSGNKSPDGVCLTIGYPKQWFWSDWSSFEAAMDYLHSCWEKPSIVALRKYPILSGREHPMLFALLQIQTLKISRSKQINQFFPRRCLELYGWVCGYNMIQPPIKSLIVSHYI